MLRLQIEWERSGANRVRWAHSQSSTSQELKPGCQLMPLPQSFRDASSTCHLHSAVSLGIHPGHCSLSASGWGDSASDADPTFGYHLQTRIADAVSGISNTTSTQHGLTALAVVFSAQRRFLALLPRSGAGGAGGRSADGAVAPARPDPRGFGNGPRAPPGTRQWLL